MFIVILGGSGCAVGGHEAGAVDEVVVDCSNRREPCSRLKALLAATSDLVAVASRAAFGGCVVATPSVGTPGLGLGPHQPHQPRGSALSGHAEDIINVSKRRKKNVIFLTGKS